MKLLKALLAIVIVELWLGVHSISVAPDLAKIGNLHGGFKLTPASVGYYIPSDLLSLEVTTPVAVVTTCYFHIATLSLGTRRRYPIFSPVWSNCHLNLTIC